MYVAVAFGVTVCEPESAFDPVHAPEAVHEDAFVDDQFNVEDCPCVIDVGDALKVTVGPPGGGGGVVVPFTKDTSSITRVPALSIKWYTDAFVTFVGTVNVAVNCFHAFADDVTFVTHP